MSLSRINSILLATDFSKRSAEAEDYAVSLARDCECSLLVVHAIEPIMGVDEVEEAAEFDDFYDKLLERADSEMEERIERWEGENLIVKHHVQIGHRWQVILEQADDHDTDLIVLGRRPFTKVRRVPLGTTSQKVFFGSSRPVLFIPSEG